MNEIFVAVIAGVEDVKTDCRTHKVVVKGKVAAADPLKVVERVEKKTGRKVELLTPIPPKPEKAEEKKVEEEPESKPDEAKEQVSSSFLLKLYIPIDRTQFNLNLVFICFCCCKAESDICPSESQHALRGLFAGDQEAYSEDER